MDAERRRRWKRKINIAGRAADGQAGGRAVARSLPRITDAGAPAGTYGRHARQNFSLVVTIFVSRSSLSSVIGRFP